jgi:hypothetical protein
LFILNIDGNRAKAHFMFFEVMTAELKRGTTIKKNPN